MLVRVPVEVGAVAVPAQLQGVDVVDEDEVIRQVLLLLDRVHIAALEAKPVAQGAELPVHLLGVGQRQRLRFAGTRSVMHSIMFLFFVSVYSNSSGAGLGL